MTLRACTKYNSGVAEAVPLFCGFSGSLQVGCVVGWGRTGTWRAELSILPPAGPGEGGERR